MFNPIPEGYHVEDNNGTLTITKKWFSYVFFITLFFSLFWNGFLIGWYSLLPTVFNGEEQFDVFVALFYLFPLLHVGVGVGLLYYSICGFFNQTEVSVSMDRVMVKIKPLPWTGSKNWNANDVKQFYTQERRTYSRNSGSSVWYDVKAILKDGKSYTFLPGLRTKEEGLFIEKSLEDRLFIKDEPVLGEVEKN